jgi:predicted small lipoprotein YifL
MSTDRMKTRRTASSGLRTALLGVCLVLFAASCGQRGPLYLPKPDAKAGVTAPSQAEAAEDSEGQADGDGPAGEDEDGNEKTP